jgi:hypothetical protein
MGDWIQFDGTRSDWMEFSKPLIALDKKEQEEEEREEDNKPALVVIPESQDSNIPMRECKCMTKFGMLGCVLYSVPVESLQKDELFETCRYHLLSRNLKTHGRKFGVLAQNHKRWCLYWYYAVNVFGIRSSARPLSDCLVDYVRFIYPNSNKTPFCGFKSTEERSLPLPELTKDALLFIWVAIVVTQKQLMTQTRRL